MPRVTVSTVVEAPAGEVWRLLRDFGRFNAWYDGMPDAVIEGGGPSDRVGAIRRFEVNGQVMAREELLALDDDARSQTYRILESVFPLREYVSRLRVLPVTDGDRSFVQWTADFEADAAEADRLAEMVRDHIYRPGLASLGKRLTGA
ncbi:SRPBCC family protein [Bailinhaonella thermotolerans]|uniref:SRPBCC family protein n=1 Tax=Bailinhaonella thermotolerans TaxID=1070861 RepID=A0A3A4BKP6_9ACTN|nr:SRPBCC family protein [Bailinhaonella thermotolerans]RJL35914.1 SRPBCC family protein [Bailinhaonella thermotolerans]